MTTDTMDDPASGPEQPPRPTRAPALPPDERRAAIVAAALPLVRQLGRAVTTRQIAEAAGIAEGTIFRVFDTKDDVIEAVVERAIDPDETIARILAIDDAAPLEATVRRCATILAERLANVVDLMIAVHRLPPDGERPSPADRAHAHRTHPGRERNEQHERTQAALAAVLTRHRHRLRTSPDRAARVLWLLVFGGTHRMISGDNPLTPTDIADLLLHGVARDIHGSSLHRDDRDGRPTHLEDAPC